MSLRTQLGPRMPLMSEAPEAARLFELDGFVMYPQGLQDLVLSPQIPFAVAGLDATFDVADGPGGWAHGWTRWPTRPFTPSAQVPGC